MQATNKQITTKDTKLYFSLFIFRASVMTYRGEKDFTHNNFSWRGWGSSLEKIICHVGSLLWLHIAASERVISAQ